MKKAPNQTDVYVGARIRHLRMLNHMSQEKLGNELGLTFQQVQKYEKGANRVGASRLLQIASIFGVQPGYFFEGYGTPVFDDSEPQKDDPILHLAQTRDGMELADAFAKIGDAKIRRAVVNLVSQIAGNAAPAEVAA
jgi:transcriptional regulator with XRE-family HTH domain